MVKRCHRYNYSPREEEKDAIAEAICEDTAAKNFPKLTVHTKLWIQEATWTLKRIINTTETILSTSEYKLLNRGGETLKSNRVVPSKEQLPLLSGKNKSEEN